MGKKKLTLSVDGELITLAHQQGLNISRLVEMALRARIRAIEEGMEGRGPGDS